MYKNYFDSEPNLIEQEGSDIRINFDVEHTTEKRENIETGETEQVEVIKAYSVRVSQPVTRPAIIDAIITAKYPNDVMQATLNNYLLNQKDTEAKQEFGTMQEWRAHAKQIATQVMEAIA